MSTIALHGPQSPSVQHLEARLARLEARVRAAVELRRVTDPNPDDAFRGLYLTGPKVEDLLSQPARSTDAPSQDDELAVVELQADAWELAGAELRLRSLARSFDLDEVDLELLLVALAPDLDARFESLYGYLHDDVTRRRASVGLAMELAGLSSMDAGTRFRLSGQGALVRHGIIVVEGVERPILTRALRVDDRVTAHLLGSDRPNRELERTLADIVFDDPHPPLVRAIAAGLPLIYVREGDAPSGMPAAAGSIAALGGRSLAVDLGRLATTSHPAELAAEAVREARMAGAILVAGELEALTTDPAGLIGLFGDSGWPTILVGARPWDPTFARTIPLLVDAPQLETADRARRWQAALADVLAGANGHEADLLDATSTFRLAVGQIDRAAQAARLRAFADGRSVEPADLRAGARAQNSGGLERLARRVAPVAEWSDLVLPPEVRSELRELASRARHRDMVLREWGIGGRTGRSRGITALFGGDSGTGKTLAAEVIAHDLGLDLYVIDLSTVVDKYIGETEKNLDRIFTEAARVNGVLLFDEADAIFGKRSEVQDAHDRYANVQVAYLLQRMERFDGLAILTTNLRANLDEAFTRRLDVIVDFPMPDEAARLALWRTHLPSELPQSADIDLGFMARRFQLSGGHIRNICTTAAFLAADRDAAASMEDLVRGTEREYRKLGRLTLEDEFGPYHAAVVAGRSIGHDGH